jgi:cyclic pyranopterin phosphate synthase
MSEFLTHLDESGNAIMVSVADKEVTKRTAIASSILKMKKSTLETITSGSAKKGDVLAVARIAGISASKETSRLIPLCHNIVLDKVRIDFETIDDKEWGKIKVTATASATGRTGVEMEALTASAIAALTIYDMCKAIDRAMTIEQTRLDYKDGGKSGEYKR